MADYILRCGESSKRFDSSGIQDALNQASKCWFRGQEIDHWVVASLYNKSPWVVGVVQWVDKE